ncbi:hypothetical protein ABB37_01759 [Leptomonas pyrrhocoris]|uniref:Uncharacterized protein n=1 Tax=Leptomonas pyrrhocoris TaxID=157538 RepID=A0A0N1J5D7_LEPPY|nr:hypothetical protein ABB37_01759 [Leptomonas pyrrhocoris]XP_015663904.1 hypothetical protein ABB37_01759 [Leptomonas pyrrhocoris]XP_015663905.1 hypothetical protein ABB37_01759 [Leptomonas pyrrhocoris]KPA85464.1 hypothetical protein ABB37_01759 [Leptomonas pyrrhocoris]KPA85465.1 hypothetical protein ABB37_01759 [Leptomonas pyrrhocoris]KPA85466.1 hypothetical protein ABB37_01759 [Leptomonas pyrrhocoris]|eukprot:XP_015663903.1 hypothetical protein ABB37_01759 [Leptomonas pyrrhocoris]
MSSSAQFHTAAFQSRPTAASANERSDMYVTALDVFNRRAYFDPQKESFTDAQLGNFGAATPLTSKRNSKVAENSTPSETQRNSGQPESYIEPNESAVCKLKHFSSAEAYMTANSVKEDLMDTLGENNSAQIYVHKELLQEKRRLFFETLFTHSDDLHTALPCRFSIDDVDKLFQDDSQIKSDPSKLYRNRLRALDRLRETLDS